MKSLREYKDAKERREAVEKERKISLPNIGRTVFEEPFKNCENLIGSVQIPLGLVGPVAVDKKQYWVPMATTEGALVASVNRGAKAISEGGGVTTVIETVGVNRGPVFEVGGIIDGQKLTQWLRKNFDLMAKRAEATSSHLKLLKVTGRMIGRYVYAKFDFDTQEAMGMNMATIATTEICKLVEKKTGAKLVSVAGNFENDKKPSWLSFYEGRGKRVWAEVEIDKKIVKKILKVTVDELVKVVKAKVSMGSVMSGSIGVNAQAANIIAAIYLATGQDPAHVVEGSLAVTTAEKTTSGDLYISVYLPAVLIGLVGGGAGLPTQKEALSIIGAKNVGELCGVIGAVVLCGELSLLASLSEGTLASAHKRLARRE